MPRTVGRSLLAESGCKVALRPSLVVALAVMTALALDATHLACAQPAAVPGVEVPDVRPPDVNLIEKRVAEAVRTRTSLAGAWLDVVAEDQDGSDAPRKLVFTRVLDRGRAGEQRRELDDLIASWFNSGTYRVDAGRDREYPYSELMAELRIGVETDPLLGGCAIADGYYAPDANQPGRLNLVLRGRIAKESNAVEIERLCATLMRADPAWLARSVDRAAAVEAPLAISPRTIDLESKPSLTVVAPSEPRGRAFYADGLNAYWKRQYGRAAAAFRQAALESPRRLEYYYWWSLADLAGGDSALAAQRMRAVVKRFFRQADFDRQSLEYRAVVRSLERVQGPLRKSLLELESRALFADSQSAGQ